MYPALVSLQWWWLGESHKACVCLDKALHVTGAVDLLHREHNLLHALQVGRDRVGEGPG